MTSICSTIDQYDVFPSLPSLSRERYELAGRIFFGLRYAHLCSRRSFTAYTSSSDQIKQDRIKTQGWYIPLYSNFSVAHYCIKILISKRWETSIIRSLRLVCTTHLEELSILAIQMQDTSTRLTRFERRFSQEDLNIGNSCDIGLAL